MTDEAPAGRRLPKRIVELTLPEPYQEFHCSLWINLPQALWRDLMASDMDTCAAAFAQIVVNHDLVDFDGKPYPPGGSPALYRELPADLVRLIADLRVAQIGKLSPPSAAR